MNLHAKRFHKRIHINNISKYSLHFFTFDVGLYKEVIAFIKHHCTFKLV